MNDPTTPRKGKMVCPHCGETATRIKRKPLDRLLSLIKPVKRYRCSFCDWTAVLPLQDERAG